MYALPVSFVQLGVGSEFGVAVTDAQPMKIAATEALWNTEQPAGFSLFQIGGFTEDDQTPSFDIEIPGLLSFLATNSFKSEVVGINELQSQYEQEFGPGNYVPDVRLVYWSMRVMAYLGTLLFLLALWGLWLVRHGGPYIQIASGGLRLEMEPPFVTWSEIGDAACRAAAEIVRLSAGGR